MHNAFCNVRPAGRILSQDERGSARMPKIGTVFAERLAFYRKQRNLSQDELAKRCGLSRGTIVAYESGKGFTMDGLARVSDALGVEESDLIFLETPPAPIVVKPTPLEMAEALLEYIKAIDQAPAEVVEHFPYVVNWNLLLEVLKTVAPKKPKQ